MREQRPGLPTIWLFAALGAIALWHGVAGATEVPEGLPDYWEESTWLLSPPGESNSLAAGLFNPSAYSVARRGGVFLGWRGTENLQLGSITGEKKDFLGIASSRNLAFSIERLKGSANLSGGSLGQAAINEYTLTLGGGSGDGGLGFSYSWQGGDTDIITRHKRLGVGLMGRERRGAIGAAAMWDLQSGDFTFQADLGIRPWGPRLSFFLDAFTQSNDFWDNVRVGLGVELQAVRGWRVSIRSRDAEEISIATSIALGNATAITAGGHTVSERAGSQTTNYDAANLSFQFGGDTDGSLIHTGRHGYAAIHLKGPMTYRRFQWFDDRRTLTETLAQLDAVSQNSRVDGVVVNLSGAVISREMMWEIREQLEMVRARGRKVIVYFDRANFYSYMLASVADEIWMDPVGDLTIMGIAAGRTYYRDALEKLGLGVEEWRYFKYKSAFEALARTEATEADKEQRQAVVDGFYETARGLITSARPISDADFDRIVDTWGRVMPQEALSEKLVDHIGTFDEAMAGAPQVASRGDERTDLEDLSGVLGDMTWAKSDWGDPDKIAILYAIGPCQMDSGIKGRKLARKIKQAREDPRVKAVVLRVDSPGGDPLPSDLVSRELMRTMQKKPVIVSQGNVAASGGYWLSMFSNEILASPFTVTGSIGVIAGWIWNKEFGEKYGFDYDSVQRGKHADFGNGIRLPFTGITIPNRPVDDEERARIKESIMSLYDDFVMRVAQGRDMDQSEVEEIAQGRIWTGDAGLDNGLVDEMGGLWKAVQLAKAAANIPHDRWIALQEGPNLGLVDLRMLRLGFMQTGAEEDFVSDISGELRPAGYWMGLSAWEIAYLRALSESGGAPTLMSPPLGLDGGTGDSW